MFSGGGYDDPGMAESAVTIAREWRISRSRQDAFAARSHARAAAAVSRGDFADEIVPCAGPTGTVALDTCPRPTLTSERLGRFPDLLPDGAGVTAGNASQIADGAAAVLVVSERVAARLGRPGIRHAGSATAGVDPRVCGIGAVAAARALHAADRRRDPRAAGHVAMTEAFASQVLATADALGLWEERLNPRGGAIALGHPWGASGAIQVVRLHAELAGRPGAGDGLALAAIAGGMGTAAWFTAREAS
jgi:acetyl-CoA C-acetyltransferase